MVGFVDDSTCITGGGSNDSYSKLKAMMTEDAQLWHDLLWTTGGKLELPKCGYHIIYYDFNDSGIPEMRLTPKNDCVTLKNDQGVEVKINGKNTYTPQKNLGHFKAPAGKRTTQCEKLAEKAKKLTSAIVRCGCDQNDSRMLFQSVWKPAIEYVLPQAFLSNKK
jgi:hypothetical protein